MKKGISKNKVQRMRNIISGNYNAKSKISSGYTKIKEDRSEGDVWIEGGKEWTIKNGIKRTVEKLSKARKINKIPYACPCCGNSLSHPAHRKMFMRWGMCLTCVSKWEQQMVKDGTFDEWSKEFDRKNFNAFITDAKQEYEQWLKDRNSKHFISEAGDIEDWSDGQSNEDLIKEFNDNLKEAMEIKNAKAN
tara:strand:+ start:6882 stop:7454 length:573 start_codon:yes stop_codon:yes gene_type:complete